MSQPKRQFRSILTPQEPDIDEIMDAVDSAAQRDDIPSLVRPSDAKAKTAAAASEGAPAATVTPLPPRRERKVNPASTVRWTIEGPEYLLKQIKERMIKEGGTQRYLTLKAFKADGYTIHDVDLYKDGRREK